MKGISNGKRRRLKQRATYYVISLLAALLVFGYAALTKLQLSPASAAGRGVLTNQYEPTGTRQNHRVSPTTDEGKKVGKTPDENYLPAGAWEGGTLPIAIVFWAVVAFFCGVLLMRMFSLPHHYEQRRYYRPRPRYRIVRYEDDYYD